MMSCKTIDKVSFKYSYCVICVFIEYILTKYCLTLKLPDACKSAITKANSYFSFFGPSSTDQLCPYEASDKFYYYDCASHYFVYFAMTVTVSCKSSITCRLQKHIIYSNAFALKLKHLYSNIMIQIILF